MIEIFRTNTPGLSEANTITRVLSTLFPGSIISFDLEDSDKVLRIEGNNIDPLRIKAYVSSMNIEIDVLSY